VITEKSSCSKRDNACASYLAADVLNNSFSVMLRSIALIPGTGLWEGLKTSRQALAFLNRVLVVIKHSGDRSKERVEARCIEPRRASGTSEGPVLSHNAEGPPPGTTKLKITTGHANVFIL